MSLHSLSSTQRDGAADAPMEERHQLLVAKAVDSTGPKRAYRPTQSSEQSRVCRRSRRRFDLIFVSPEL